MYTSKAYDVAECTIVAGTRAERHATRQAASNLDCLIFWLIMGRQYCVDVRLAEHRFRLLALAVDRV